MKGILKTNGFKAQPLWLKAAVIGLMAMLIVSIVSPPVLKTYLNSVVLSNMGSYEGHVEKVRIHPLKGYYALNELVVRRSSSQKDVPFFKVDSLRFHLSLKAIFKGDLVFVAELVRPEVNFMDAEKEEDKQTGEGGNWLQTLETVLPDTLGEIRVENGSLSFKNMDSNPRVDLRANNVDIRVINLAGTESKKYGSKGEAIVSGDALEHGVIDFKASFDHSNLSNFQMRGSIKNLKLSSLNDISRVYANLDFKSGEGDIFTEITGGNGTFSGYVKPLFTNVDVLSWEQDIEEQGDSLIQFAWEGIAGLLQTLLTNPVSDKLATKIEFEKQYDELNVDALSAFWGVITNAFVDTMSAGFDGDD